MALNEEFVRVLTPGGKSKRLDYYSHPVETASYIIYKEGNKIKAKNGQTGQIEFSDEDAATVIQQAIDALINGGKIFIKAGTYTIENAGSAYGVQITNNDIMVEGEGDKTVLKAADDSNFSQGILFVAYYRTNIAIRNLKLDGNKANQATYGRLIQIRRSTHVLIEKVSFVDGYKEGLVISDNEEGRTYDITIKNCYFEGNRENGIVVSSNAEKVIIDSNRFYNNGEANVAYTGAILFGTPTSRFILITNNIIWNHQGSNVNIAGIHGRDLTGGEAIIANNQIYNGSSQGMLFYNCKNLNITGNVVRGNTRVGIYLEGASESIVVDNLVVGNGAMGIDVASYEDVTSNDTKVIGNYVASNGRCGIYCGAVSSNLVIACNTVKNNAQTPSANDYENTGIIVLSQNSIVIGNRVFDDQTTKTQKYGISDKYGDMTGSNSMFKDNDVRGNDLAGMYIAGTNQVVKYNSGYVTENIGTATIPNGSSSVVVNHGLATAPSVVKLTGTHSEVANCWVTNVTDTQFTINAPAAVTGDRDVYWEAEV